MVYMQFALCSIVGLSLTEFLQMAGVLKHQYLLAEDVSQHSELQSKITVSKERRTHMSVNTQTTPHGKAEVSTSLLKNSMRFFTIVLMVTAAAAPLVVVSAYIPISIAFGAGMSVPVTYAAATIILLIFTVGFAQMAKRITASGAFYNYTTKGLGKSVGLGAGLTVMLGYSMIAPAIAGGFGYYFSSMLSTYLAVDVPWWVSAIGVFILMWFLSYFKVTLTGRILGTLLTLEVLVVFIVATATIFQGGAEGQLPGTLSPTAWAAAPAVGIGFFLAFWSWIGFETTAIYGEETADPKKSVPRATYIAVITLGVFYTYASYAAVVGFGNNSVEQANNLLGQYYFVLADMYTVPATRVIMDFLVITGFFACSFAFFNNASRYLFSMGRDHILPRRLGHTNSLHKSPYVANGVQAVISIIVVLIFALIGADPLLHLGTWLPIFSTLAVIGVQLLVSFAVIGYFNKEGRRTAGDWWKTLVAPILGAVAMIVVIYLLITNLPFIAGSEDLVVTLIPYYVLGVFVIGVVYALYLKKAHPSRYDRIGTVYDDEDIEEIAVTNPMDDK